MASDDALIVPGVVEASYRGDRHVVVAVVDGHPIRVLCKRAGRLVTRYLKVLPGDRVEIEVNAYDPSRGRIVQRRG